MTFAELLAQAFGQQPAPDTSVPELDPSRSQGGSFATGLINMFQNALTAPKKALSGEMTIPQSFANGPSVWTAPGQDPGDAAIGAGLDTAGLGLTGGLVGNAAGLIPKEGVGIFGGKLAKTADLAQLARAQEMAAERVPTVNVMGQPVNAAVNHPRQIWEETGWFQGADGQWRFEIPDATSTVTGKIPDLKEPTPVSALLDHAKLFEAYPDLANTKVFAGSPQKSGAYYKPEPGLSEQIMLSAKDFSTNPTDARSVMLHELQHAVQNREGFAPGTNLVDVTQHPEFAPKVTKLFDHMIKELSVEDASHNAQTKVARELYDRTAGEVEARNVQRRQNLSPMDWGKYPPMRTQEFTNAEQLLPQGWGVQKAEPPSGFDALREAGSSFDKSMAGLDAEFAKLMKDLSRDPMAPAPAIPLEHSFTEWPSAAPSTSVVAPPAVNDNKYLRLLALTFGLGPLLDEVKK